LKGKYPKIKRKHTREKKVGLRSGGEGGDYRGSGRGLTAHDKLYLLDVYLNLNKFAKTKY
jgi:hypothetical protein